jgi:hypothetical protein
MRRIVGGKCIGGPRGSHMDAEQRPRAWPSPDAHTIQAVEVAFRAWAGARDIGLRLGGLFGLPPAVYDDTMRL